LKRNTGLILALAAASLLTACGEDPAGPDVRGMTLPDAKAALAEAGVEASAHAEDAAFGILIEENFVVCEVEAVNERMVRLEVAKRGC
jgi:major membrane immunogen (membrane-anchored lipoprotein)